MIENDEQSRIVAGKVAGARRRRRRAHAAAARARRVRRAGKDPRPALDLHRGDAQAQGSARPRAPVRSAGTRQDDAVAHHRARARRQPAPDVGAGAGARRRPRGAAHQPRAQRRSVHRRDPPAVARRRGDPVSRARGLPDRHHDRRGPGGAQREARPAAVHAGRRDDPRRNADQSAARPLRDRRAARVLHRRGARAHRHALGRAAQHRHRRERRARDRAARARDAANREPAAAPRPRLRRGAGPGRDHARGRRRRAHHARRRHVRVST